MSTLIYESYIFIFGVGALWPDQHLKHWTIERIVHIPKTPLSIGAGWRPVKRPENWTK
jgi:hypothetical protein